MKVCFHHEHFDRDVSSGTSHAMYQWFELLQAFGIGECAIINLSGDSLPVISSTMIVHEYPSFDAFLTLHGGDTIVQVEVGGVDYREFDFTPVDWLCLGGTAGLPSADVGIATNGSLYPREAAAIIMAKALG